MPFDFTGKSSYVTAFEITRLSCMCSLKRMWQKGSDMHKSLSQAQRSKYRLHLTEYIYNFMLIYDKEIFLRIIAGVFEILL